MLLVSASASPRQKPSSLVKRMPDIERNGYNFSDGVGTTARIVAHLLTQDFVGDRRISSDYQVSCFQFYLGGHKGVLALDPKAVNLDVHLRPSQGKSRSPHKTSKEAAQNWKQTVETTHWNWREER
jgi:hypothetical protein